MNHRVNPQNRAFEDQFVPSPRLFSPANSERAVWLLARISRDPCRRHDRGQRMSTAAAEAMKYAGYDAATWGRVPCLVDMKHFLVGCGKVLLVVALALVIIHLWPITVVPLAAGFVLLLGLGVALMLALAATGAMGLAAVAGLVGAAVVLLAVLAPVWIPVLIIVGIVWLVKRLTASRAPGAAAT
jgi:hypothetical protein